MSGAMKLNRYDCCEHCEHDINDPPHDLPCPEGCAEEEPLRGWTDVGSTEGGVQLSYGWGGPDEEAQAAS